MGRWDSPLNPLEVSWACQRNTGERGRPLDNPEDAIAHLTTPQSHATLYPIEVGAWGFPGTSVNRFFFLTQPQTGNRVAQPDQVGTRGL